MKKILIVSDTHRRNENYFTAIERHQPQMVIHCGDVEGSEYALSEAAGCPVHMVSGNNDFFSGLPDELDLEIGPYKVWVLHGHTCYVSMGNQMLKREAEARGKDIVMYGHTHRPVIDLSGEVMVINPGSLAYPRQEGRRPSYILMELEESGEVHFTICYL